MIKTQRKTPARREQIINAARKLVIKYGSENVTIRRIAVEVGFSEAAVYRHFKSKKDILLLLIESIENSLLSDLQACNGENDTFTKIEDILIRHLSSVEMRRGVAFQVIAEIVSLGDKKLNRRIFDTVDRYISELTKILNRAQEKGQLRNDLDTEAAAMILFSVVQGLSNVWTLQNYNFDPKEKFAPILNILKNALL